MTALATAAATNTNFPSNAGINTGISRGIWDVWGTMGGATVKLQRSPDGGTTWTDVPNASTANAAISLEVAVGQGIPVRINIAGGSGASINSSIVPV